MTPLSARTYVALVHHPVMDKNSRVVATAVTNLDIHDIARATRTFGLAGYFLVTPIAAQRDLISRIVGHWTHGEGLRWNDKRSSALGTVRVADSLAEARKSISEHEGRPPLVVATGARGRPGVVGFRDLVTKAENDRDAGPMLLVFGTGWGLADEVFSEADDVLVPIRGPGNEYNHLSVRSAVAIVLDRLFGNRD
ncbi:MAG: RNA methyltransferase [Deltaproteobacteria bacterium]|nr:RNA methyltransferase [Deltaproteobacteria bacterium]